MKIDEILEEFENKNFAKIYFLEGEEEVFKNEFLQSLKKKINYPEFNWSIHYAEEIDSEEFFHSLFSLPFLSQLKIIVIKNAEELPSKIITQLSKNTDKIPSTNCFILSSSKISASLRQLISKNGRIVLFRKPTRPQIRQWAARRLKEDNKRIDSDAFSLLLENTGANFSLLARELDKLIAYAKDKEIIGLKDIKEVGIDIKTYDIFALIDNISKKNTHRSLNILRMLLSGQTSPQQIIGMLRWQFAKLWETKALILKGVNNYKALEQAKIPYFKRNEFLAHTKAFSWEDLKAYFNLLLDTDIRIKRGGEPELSMELLLFRITK